MAILSAKIDTHVKKIRMLERLGATVVCVMNICGSDPDGLIRMSGERVLSKRRGQDGSYGCARDYLQARGHIGDQAVVRGAVSGEPAAPSEAARVMPDARTLRVPTGAGRVAVMPPVACACLRPAGLARPRARRPLLDWSRRRSGSNGQPRYGADQALLELIDGLRKREGIETPPLASDTGGPMRVRELLTGVGGRDQ